MISYWIFKIIIVVIIGLSVGSFLNVVIYRLPREESIVYPASRCPVCGIPIKLYDNIPLFSFIMLKGKCRYCSTPIPVQYPLVECLTGCMALWLFFIHGLSLSFAGDFFLGAFTLSVAFIDARHMIIPNRLSYTGIIIAVFIKTIEGFHEMLRGFEGALVGVLLLMIMYWMGKVFYKREGVGLGDVKFAAVVGLLAGPFWCFIALMLGILIGGVWGIVTIFIGKKIQGVQVPFGPFMACGVGIILFFRGQLLSLLEQYISMFR